MQRWAGSLAFFSYFLITNYSGLVPSTDMGLIRLVLTTCGLEALTHLFIIG